MTKEVFKLNKKYMIIPIVTLGLFIVLIEGIFKSYAVSEPIESISFSSEKLNYENHEPGSVGITKSAKWISNGKAKITINVNTTRKTNNHKKDVIFVLDISESMTGPK